MHSLAAASSLDDDDIWIRRLFHLISPPSASVRPSFPQVLPSERCVRTYGRSFAFPFDNMASGILVVRDMAIFNRKPGSRNQ